MPPKSTPVDKKQTTLFGFLSKAPPSSSPSARPASNGAGASSSVARPTVAAPSSSSAKLKAAAKPTPASSSKDVPASSSPLNRSSEVQPLRKKIVPLGALLPSPASSAASATQNGALVDLSEDGREADADSESVAPTSDLTSSGLTDMDVDEDEDEHPVGRSTRVKRKAAIVESDMSGTEDEAVKPKAKSAGKGAAKKPRKSVPASDDEFELDDDDEELIAAAAGYDNVGTTESESDATVSSSSTIAPRKKTAPAAARKKSAAPPARPSIKPTQSGASASGGGGGGGSSNAFLTQAEIRRAADKQQKKDDMDCFDFLVDLRDADGKRPGDEDYDPRTLYIPRKAWDKFTPFETQFWEIKQNHFDTILFFQKGKFFELYENDARIGNTEFDLKLTDRVKMCMVGVPEQNFEMWAAKFLAAGYKVGRVEQAETALAMEMRQKAIKGQKVSQSDKIVRRELKKVLTNGTVSDATFLAGDDASHCVAIKETVSAAGQSSFGVVVLDAATGAFLLSSFEDDIVKTKLETMFRQLQPKELIHEKGNLEVNTLRTLRSVLPSSCVWSSLRPSEFLAPEQTLERLSDYFAAPGADGEDAQMAGPLPGVLEGFKENDLVLRALGGLLSYLKQLNLDKDLLSQRNFDIYDPIRANKSLVLNGNTLAHIEVLVNSEGGTEGTLYALLQKCVTPFGKRLFRVWLCHPLRDTGAINARLDAVEEIMNHPTFLGDFKKLSRGLPDLERLISRIHASNCKVDEFMRVLDAFTAVQRGLTKLAGLAEAFESTSTSALLRSAPDLEPHLEHIRSLFTYDKDTVDVLPADGVDEAYEEVQIEIDRLEKQLDELLRDHAKEIGCRELSYWHSAQGQKEIYQIQVPVKFKAPKSWTKTGSVKAFNRYASPETAPVIRELQEARETRTQTVRAFIRRLLAEFDNDRDTWLMAVKIVGELDCLGSLAVASQELDEPKCRPTFIESDHAQVKFESLRHPAMCLRADFIPNDVMMGGDQAKMVLLTGPNMAGKSTLLRTTAAGVIMAQLGMYVPAASATISPVDAISTRMGAYDLLFGHASTFKVELDECSKILAEAGPRSLVILDELGRGTSTYDGMAIAAAVLHHLASKSLPLGFFATHYGSLANDFAYHPNVRPMHMRTQVDEEKREVTFLYKLIDGKAESSHGTHVARLAGVPEEVVSRAEAVSHQFFDNQQARVSSRRQSTLPLVAHTDFAFLLRLALADKAELPPGGAEVFRLLRRSIPGYEEAVSDAVA